MIGVEASKRIEFVQDLLQAEAMRPDQIAGLQYSPYRHFTREEWARLRADTPMTLVAGDLAALSGLSGLSDLVRSCAILSGLDRISTDQIGAIWRGYHLLSDLVRQKTPRE